MLSLRKSRAQVLLVGTQRPRVLSEGSLRSWVLPVGTLSLQVPRFHAFSESAPQWVLLVQKRIEVSAGSIFFSCGNQQAWVLFVLPVDKRLEASTASARLPPLYVVPWLLSVWV